MRVSQCRHGAVLYFCAAVRYRKRDTADIVLFSPIIGAESTVSIEASEALRGQDIPEIRYLPDF
jgi:hypothetical protein